MEEGEEVEQECMSMPSSSSSSSSSINDVILAPINHILTSPVERELDDIEGEGMGEQPPSKPRYFPKPPKRKGGKLKRSKVSSYDWEMAREEMMMAVASLSWTVWPSIAITGARGSRPLVAILFRC